MFQKRCTLKKFLREKKKTPAPPRENQVPGKEEGDGLGSPVERDAFPSQNPHLQRSLSPLPGQQHLLEAVLAPNADISLAGSVDLGWEPDCEQRTEIVQSSEWEGWTGKFKSIQIKFPIWH